MGPRRGPRRRSTEGGPQPRRPTSRFSRGVSIDFTSRAFLFTTTIFQVDYAQILSGLMVLVLRTLVKVLSEEQTSSRGFGPHFCISPSHNVFPQWCYLYSHLLVQPYYASRCSTSSTASITRLHLIPAPARLAYAIDTPDSSMLWHPPIAFSRTNNISFDIPPCLPLCIY